MRTVDISKDTDDFIKNLPPKQFRQIFTTILNLRKNVTPHDWQIIKDFKDLYRVDIGEYRVIYRYDDDCVYITLVGKRNDDDVYKKLKR